MELYLINDQNPRPSSLRHSNLIKVCTLEEDYFERLQRLNLIDERFDYYKDLRWGYGDLKMMKQKINQINYQDGDRALIDFFSNLIGKAIEQKVGLIGYSN